MDAVKAEVDLSQAPRRVTVLGSTGSVGANTLDLRERTGDGYVVEGRTAISNVALLAEQARRLKPPRPSWRRAPLSRPQGGAGGDGDRGGSGCGGRRRGCHAAL